MWTDDLDAARQFERSDPTSRYAQLATVGRDGRPRCRTVVVRRVDNTTLDIVTDERSAKVGELASQPWVELCWYFAKARAQFRLSGSMRRLDAKAAVELWAGLSAAGQASFGWPAPGAARAAPTAFDVQPPSEMPSTFIALRLEVQEVDHLDLRPSPHVRSRHTKDGDGWRKEALNP